jgi:hypothetical protein
MPTPDEMHPQLHHKSTATPYDEARWLGFFQMGPQTEPVRPKAPGHINTASPTPAKVQNEPQKNLEKVVASDFQFTFKRQPSLELSAEAQQLMAESREEAAKIRLHMLANLPSVPEGSPANRKFAKPKGKAGRFSDVHMAEFKKMDSIANHPSAWRLDQSRHKPATTGLKRSPSKAELDAPAPTSLKRSPSKAELDAPVTTTLKRSPSKVQLNAPTATVLKRMASKPQLNPTENSPFVTKPASRFGYCGNRDEAFPASPAKRIKHDKTDDAATNRPVSRDGATEVATPGKAIRHLYSGIHKPLSGVMTPTKASLARTQSLKNLRAVNNMNPALVRSRSSRNLLQPKTPPRSAASTIPKAVPTPTPAKVAVFSNDTAVKAPEELTSPPSSKKTFSAIKSILRTPHRLYSDDPTKIAAGTHMATPPDVNKGFPQAPATAPVRKHVDFTSSTKENTEKKIIRAMSVEPDTVTYPTLPGLDSPDRRTTFSAVETPGTFTFRSGKAMSFSPAAISTTIREVRSSNVGLPSFSFTVASPQKRKLDSFAGISEEEKENRDDDDEGRPSKKARKDEKPGTSKQIKKNKLPTHGTPSKRPSGITTSRLQLLAMPKRRR